MKKILLLAFTASVMLGACKKSDDTSKDETCTKVSSYTDLYEDSQNTESVTYNVTYDSQSRISKIVESDGGFSLSYIYNTGSIIEDTMDGTYMDHRIYTLDNQNRIIKESDGSIDDLVYTYDTDGYLKEIEDAGTVVNFKWVNGNLAEREEQGNKTSYTYYDEIAPQNYILVTGDGSGYNNSSFYNYYGKTSKNLLKSTTKANYKVTYQYEKDTNGRVTKVIETHGGGEKYTYSINYSCN